MKKSVAPKTKSASLVTDKKLSDDIRILIGETRQQVAQTINVALVLRNWHTGKRINDEVLKNKRVEYGKEIVLTLSRQLATEYGKGFTDKNLLHMMRFAEVFPNKEILYSVRRELGWTHFRHIIYLKDQLKRDFYAETCRIERWSTRTLADKINGIYERTALSKKPEQLIKQEIEAL